jgi:peroxiredoxin
MHAMARTDNIYQLPENLPVPIDDGACDHLAGMRVPSIPLKSTAGSVVDLATLPGRTVLYCYPRTGRPDVEPPNGWNEIPGARGCTPESCAFRDNFKELQALGAKVFGLSAQSSADQREAAERLHLPFELLSDAKLVFANALRLPTFQIKSMTLIKRLTLILRAARIEKVFYPVFPPDKNAEEVLQWLSRQSGQS